MIMLLMVLRACLIIILFRVCGSVEVCGRTCLMNKDTFTCTDVPICIPDGVTRVVVNNTSYDPVIITTSNFTGRNWDKVTYFRLVDITNTVNKDWTLSEDSFVALESVRELHINIRRLTKIDPNALVGLSKVETIDFTGCHSLNINELLVLLNGTNKLVGLKKIILSEWNKWFDPGYNFDDTLVDVLLPRNITDLDLSHSYINLLNLTAILKRMKHVKSLNISFTTVGYIYADGLRPNDTGQLNSWDMSGFGLALLTSYPHIRYAFNNLTTCFSSTCHHGVHDYYWHIFLSAHSLNVTGVFKTPFALWLNDTHIIVTKEHHYIIKELELKENNLNRLDVRILGGNLTFDLEYLGLSKNKLEYLHSSILACSPNLTKLDLSRNKMYVMYDEDPQQFGQLLSGVPAITYINLSKNNLTYIPPDFFKGSRELLIIDLAYNSLSQFTLNLSGLTKLKRIDMRSNNIKTLDASSLHKLDSFQPSESRHVGNHKVILTSNPIGCSVCSAKPFLRWLLSTQLVDIKSQGLNCIDERDNMISIDDTAISAVNSICIRSTIIISVTVSATTVLFAVIAVFVWLYKRRTLAKILSHRHAVIDRIRMAEGPYEFPIFLSYSSKDDVFAQNNVLPHLDDNLRQILGIYDGRKLVCTGDANLRPGFYVHDEIDMCLDRCSVVIILVTEDYCMSNYCGTELEKAYIKKKPVILMFKEHVNEDLMSRTMSDIYKRYVRILWEEQNGLYVLQTTWANVCTSIIDLIE